MARSCLPLNGRRVPTFFHVAKLDSVKIDEGKYNIRAFIDYRESALRVLRHIYLIQNKQIKLREKLLPSLEKGLRLPIEAPKWH
jgi:hypothetical protein